MPNKTELLQQEWDAVLLHFSQQDAFDLGMAVRELAAENRENISVSIKRGMQLAFFCAGAQTSQDNEHWIRRKRNVVERHGHSSLYIRCCYDDNDASYYQKLGTSPADYAIHGGGFPIRIQGTGVVGSIIVSGLAGEEDHDLCYRGLLQLKEAQKKQSQ